MRAPIRMILALLAIGVIILIARPAQAVTFITDDIISDTTWTATDSPYVIQNSISVDFGVTLTIEPGVIVKFSGPDPYSFSEIEIYGKLTAEGTANEQIYFTSYYDDSVGGDTNGDGPATAPNPNNNYGRWYGLVFTFSDTSNIKNTNFYWARVALATAGANLNVSDSEFRNNSNDISTVLGSNVSAVNLNLFDSKNESVKIYESSFTGDNILIEGTKKLNALNVSGGSDLTLSNSIIRNNNCTISVRVDESDIHFSNVSISNVPGYGIEIGGPAIIDLDNVSVTGVGSARGDAIFAYYPGTVLNVSNSVLDTGGRSGISINDNVIANIENTVIKNFTWDGLGDFGGVTVNLDGTQIFNNNYGIYSEYDNDLPDSVYYVTNSVISGNASYGAYADVLTPIDLTEIYWGDPTGPYHPTLNPGGLGNEVSDNVLFDPWCINESCATRDPVILIPGITGSYLFKNYDDYDEIWLNLAKMLLPGADSYLNDLALLTDGSEDPQKPLAMGDIIRSIATTDVFSGLIDELTANGYTENTDLFVFPYDWRKSNADNAVLLKNKIDQALIDTGRPKADIIAHSMGGLLAKKYIADEGIDKVDQLIFIGTPHLGAPKAFKILMYGDDMGYRKILLGLNPNRIKIISQNMPAVYELLPSRKYVDQDGNKYVIDARTSPEKILDYDETEDFMISQGRNGVMFPGADDLHQDTDNLDLSGVDVHNFAGCGNTKTIGGIIAKKKKSKTSAGQRISDDYQLQYKNGDSTVPLLSSIEPYGEKYYVKGFSHAELPSASGLKETIVAVLRGEIPASFPNISSDLDTCRISGKVVSAHSPVELHIYDGAGNHTGPTPDGDIEYGIDDVTYDEIEGSKFAFLPDGADYRVVNRALDTGAYNFYIENINGDDDKTGEYYWDEIPLDALSANSEILIGPAVANYMIKMDADGDGIFEKEFPPSSSLDAFSAGDLTAPETASAISDGNIILSATDDNAGVLKTEYSLNNGVTWQSYSAPISISSVPANVSVEFFSTDKAGNIESIKSVSAPAPNAGGVVLIPSQSPVAPSAPAPASVSPPVPSLGNSGGVVIIPSKKKQPVLARKNVVEKITAKTAPKSSGLAIQNEKNEIVPETLTASVALADVNLNFWERIKAFIRKIFKKK